MADSRFPISPVITRSPVDGGWQKTSPRHTGDRAMEPSGEAWDGVESGCLTHAAPVTPPATSGRRSDRYREVTPVRLSGLYLVSRDVVSIIWVPLHITDARTATRGSERDSKVRGTRTPLGGPSRMVDTKIVTIPSRPCNPCELF